MLHSLVKKVTSTGEVIALDHPNVQDIFKRPQKNASSQTLIADGRSIAEKASSLVGLFTENGLMPTFVNDMRSHSDSLESSMQLQTESTGERIRANADMRESVRRLGELLERLDIVVRNKYANDPGKLAAWESARRLEKTARPRRNGEENAAPPAPQP